MLPLFKSHYSIGKSILTLSDPGSSEEDSSDSIFDILVDNNISKLTLVEDSPTGFLQARKVCFNNNIDFIFGLRLCLSCSTDDKDSVHKIIVFAKNDSGCKKLNLIYSDIFCNFKGIGSYECLKKNWSEEDLLLAVPFYDSFLYKNSLTFGSCIPDFSFCKPLFFIEDNNLPIDNLLSPIVINYCNEFNYEYITSKSIFYKNRKDLEAFQTYKCICNRNFGRKKTLSNPGLENFGSREFCFESWKENVNE